MRAKIVISIPKKNPTMTDAFEVFYYKKINVKNIREANERIIKVWNTNIITLQLDSGSNVVHDSQPPNS